MILNYSCLIRSFLSKNNADFLLEGVSKEKATILLDDFPTR